MEKIKFTFDRKPLSEEVINQKQDFDAILKAAKTTPKNSFSKYYYFGAIGLAGVAATIGLFHLLQSHHSSDNEALAMNEMAVFSTDYDADENTVQLAFNDRTANYNFVAMQTMEEATTPVAKAKPVVAPIKAEEIKADEIGTDKVANEVVENTPSTPTIVSNKPAIPVIAGVSQGNINWEDFKTNTIFVNQEQLVKQFTIQYTSRSGDRSVTVNGNQITAEIIKELEQVGKNQTVFITNIVSSTPSNETKRLLSMELNVVFK